ncbi:MAG TPA: S9 family peptidase [Ktedonobacterales bacterium]|jgi:dipeptidyl aminopeptidase/acylaminoacyl peptidase|nr:S9 family peptidase [Ktedonobacterales bacterium]
MTTGQGSHTITTPAAPSEFVRYLNVRSAYGASFAPDGHHITFLTDITGVAEVWRVPITPGGSDTSPAWPEQLTFSGERIAGASYSPVDDRLIVGGDIGGNERTQLFLMSGDGTTLTPLTDQPEAIHVFGGWQEDGAASNGWSPDGKRIAYASNARDLRFFDIYERDVDDLASEPRLLLHHDGTNYPTGYAPDGRSVLVERLDSNIRNALLLVDTTTGEVRQITPEVTEGPARHIVPQWSSDGRGLYLLSDRGRQFLSPAWLDLATAEMTYLREDQWDADGLALSPDRRRMALVTNVDGASQVELFEISAGWEGCMALPSPDLPQGVVAGVQWSPDGKRIAFTFAPPDDAMDVWIWDVASKTRWRATQSARGGLPDTAFVTPQLVRYPTFDERQIPAYFFLPRGVEPRNLPLVVHVHGGPESQVRPVFNSVIQYLAASGYAVLAPNVRGSSGYGYAYQRLDDVRLRMDSVADLAAAVRWLGDQGIADPRRIAVMGGSYGGFMTLAALTTYPDLWAAGVDIVGIANFVTFLENTGPWRRKLREPEYGSLENDREFLEAISPIRNVDAITAALFVVHGANDPRVPVGEAEQIVAALHARGVPVEYLRFEDEGHGLIKRANRVKAYPEIARFLDAHVKNRA